MRSSPDATPSSALRKPEKVTDDWYLAAQCKMCGHGRDEDILPIFASLHSFVEGGVNVLDEYKTAVRDVGKEVDELVVGESSFREVQQADVV